MIRPRIEVHPDAGALALAVAGALIARLADVQQGGGVAQIVLTGGTIADAVHHELARLAPGSEVDWSRVVIWWGDERFLASGDPDRNAAQARTAFLDAIDLNPANVHEMASTQAAVSVQEGARDYESAIRAHGSGLFDVVMLGVGTDGHVASLFPGHAELDVEDRIAVAVTDSPKPPRERMSLTIAALNRTKAVWLLASGAGKADAVARALGGSEGSAPADLHEIPAVGVNGRDETVWFLDRGAACAL